MASITSDQRLVLNNDLLNQISRAAQSYSARERIANTGAKAASELQDLQQQSALLQREKRQLRLSIQQLQESWVALQQGGITAAQALKAQTVVRSEQRTILTLAKEQYLEEMQGGLPSGNTFEGVWSTHASKTAQAVTVAGVIYPQLEASEQRLGQLQEQSLALDQEIAQTQQIAESAAQQLTSIQGITKDVHDQVLLLQGQMSRIDAQLRTKAERALIEKGLLVVGTGATHAAADVIEWPADGPVSAGFHNADYQKHFGVPHLGMDIVVPQGTPVHSAAAGIVFMVRDGGATGYTYILIGHKDGLATLYGHLSQTEVAAGQRVEAGQEIGRSGGTPGTPGAGPMTTAAHLHFEVIENGVNVDPKTVLPLR